MSTPKLEVQKERSVLLEPTGHGPAIQSEATGELSRAGTVEKIKLLPKRLPEREREGGKYSSFPSH